MYKEYIMTKTAKTNNDRTLTAALVEEVLKDPNGIRILQDNVDQMTVREIKASLKNFGISTGYSSLRKADLLVLLRDDIDVLANHVKSDFDPTSMVEDIDVEAEAEPVLQQHPLANKRYENPKSFFVAVCKEIGIYVDVNDVRKVKFQHNGIWLPNVHIQTNKLSNSKQHQSYYLPHLICDKILEIWPEMHPQLRVYRTGILIRSK